MTALTKLLSSKGEVNYPDQTITINPPINYANSLFGFSAAISDNYAIVGGYNYGSGVAYTFNSYTGELVAELSAPSSSSFGRWGYAVATTDNYAIVGGYLYDDLYTDSGLAAIFNPATGALLHTLNNPNAYSTTANDYFGYSVAISDNYAIVGAYLEDDPGGTSSGKAYIFNPATGALLHTLDNPNAYSTSTNDYFGFSVAISDNYAIVGAHQEDDAGGTSSGKAYIFNPATGALLHTLNNPNAYSTSTNDYFGYSVAISDNYAIVGAYGEDDAEGTTSGKAYIFDTATGTLLHTLANPNAYSTTAVDYFGVAVAISDNYAIVGAHQEDDAGGDGSGVAYVFDPATGALLHTLNNPNAYSTSANDNFGRSVGISNARAIVGAPQEDVPNFSNVGIAYIFVDL